MQQCTYSTNTEKPTTNPNSKIEKNGRKLHRMQYHWSIKIDNDLYK